MVLARCLMLQWRLLLAVLAASLAVAEAAPAATFDVDAADVDGSDLNPGDGVCSRFLSNRCTLRAAIEEANALPGADDITFTGVSGELTLEIALPPITEEVHIDGGFANGRPRIELDGDDVPVNQGGQPQGDADGVRIEAGQESSIRGLIIHRWRNGVWIAGPGDNTIAGSWIGLDPSGQASPNLRAGVSIHESPTNTVGGPATADRNVVSGNGAAGQQATWGSGILIVGIGATQTRVLGNRIGTDASGETRIPNLLDGVTVSIEAGDADGPAGTEIEGGNVIAGNGRCGIQLIEAPRTKIRANRIGLGADGTALGNAHSGIGIDRSPFVEIGGPGSGNVISANGFGAPEPRPDGITASGTATVQLKVEGNNIGTNAAGDALDDGGGLPTGNGGAGVSLTGEETTRGAPTGAVIGGTAPEQRNVISGNRVGVAMVDRANDNFVQGNHIGTNRAGTAALGNQDAGVLISGADGNVVGGAFAAGERNIISGNAGQGVQIQGFAPFDNAATGNFVEGNYIGTAANGTSALPNGSNGVFFSGRTERNTIGHAPSAAVLVDAQRCEVGPCNRIRHNGGTGVRMPAAESTRNTVRGNSITANGNGGIDLGAFQVTPNDVDDADAGANGQLNFPVGVMAYMDEDPDPANRRRTISGRVVGPSPETLRVDVYAEPTPDPVAGEGRTYVKTVTPKRDGSFAALIDASAGSFFSATATDANGNTSEFSDVCADPDGDGDPDSDHDALCDEWERSGIDYDLDGNVDLELNDSPFGADWAVKDLFVEVDYMERTGVSHKPAPGFTEDVPRAFRESPVDMGTGVRLHLSPGGQDGVDEAIAEVNPLKVGPPVTGPANDFLDLRDGDPAVACDGRFGTADERRDAATCWKALGARALTFRYAIFGNSIDEPPDPDGLVSTGRGDLEGGDNLFVALGPLTPGRIEELAGGRHLCPQSGCKSAVEASTFMHELGHTLGLRHGGADSAQYKPNYLSVMNYTYADKEVVPTRPLDYSRWELPDLDETALVEADGITGATPPPSSPPGIAGWRVAWPVYRPASDKCTYEVDFAIGSVDWDLSGGLGTVSRSINEPDTSPGAGPEACQVAPAPGAPALESHDDWENLDYNHRDNLGAGWAAAQVGDPEPPGEVEPTLGERFRNAEGTDFDGDGHANASDNCTAIANADQADGDGDGLGDACEQPYVEPPANLDRPLAAGEARATQSLGADRGRWRGDEPMNFAYQWFSCNSAGDDCVAAVTGPLIVLQNEHVGRRMKVRVTGTNDGGSWSADSDLSAAVSPSAPMRLLDPRVFGEELEGRELRTDAGAWSGAEPMTFAYQWRRCAANFTGCTDIPGATQATYTLGPADVGSRLRSRVTATNAIGSEVAESGLSEVVGLGPPFPSGPAVVSGTPRVGETVTTSLGSWIGTQPIARAVRWERCSRTGAGCAAIDGATAASHTLTAGDFDHTIYARVIATNVAGRYEILSASIGPIGEALPGQPGGSGSPGGAGGSGGQGGAGGGSGPGGPFGSLPANPLSGVTGDVTAPGVTAKVTRTKLARLRRRGLRATVACSEPCTFTATLLRRGKRSPLGRAIGKVPTAGGRANFVVKLNRASRRSLARVRKLRGTLRVTAVDGAGNAKTVSRSVSAAR